MSLCFPHTSGALLIKPVTYHAFITNGVPFFLPQFLFMCVFGAYTMATGVTLWGNAIFTAFNFHRLYLVTLLQIVRSSFLLSDGSQATVFA